MAQLFTPEINSVFNSPSPSPKTGKKPLFDEDIKKVFNRNVTTTSTKDPVVQAYEELPEYQKAFQAADDMARLFSTGATYGGIDTFSDEEARLTDEARRRAGIPGTLMELGGGFASPVTRAVGAAGKAIAPVGKGLVNWLGKALTTSGEGATIGGLSALAQGRPEDALSDAAWGSAIPHGVKLAFKALTIPTKYTTSFLAGRKPENYTTAFNVGKMGDKETVAAFRRGLSGKGPTKVAKPAKPVETLEPKWETKLEKKPVKPAKPTPLVRGAWRAGHNLSAIRPSRASIGTAAGNLWPTYFIDPSVIGISLGALLAGSPRLGGEIAHGIGKMIRGANALGPQSAQTVLPYEQYNRTGKVKKKKKDEE